MRQIVLDTETTGLDVSKGHRIIEIGCVEIVNRRMTGRNYHQYLQPDREIEDGALAVHGISAERLEHEPRFADICSDLLEYLSGTELIIHNAPFDVGFINYELTLMGPTMGNIEGRCDVIDTLMMAKQMHPGQRNNLDALCKRYSVDNSAREVHGALLDAQLLAEVYLAMTGGQASLLPDSGSQVASLTQSDVRRVDSNRSSLLVIRANEDELRDHEAMLDHIDQNSEDGSVWRRTPNEMQAEDDAA